MTDEEYLRHLATGPAANNPEHYDACNMMLRVADRLAGLSAVVERLPKTEDKKPVVPGQVVYYTYGKLVALPMVVPEFSEWFYLEHSEGVLALAQGEFMHEGNMKPISMYVEDCWSTEAAALAAREEGTV